MSVEPGERGQPSAEDLTDFPVPQEASVGLDLGKTSEGTFDPPQDEADEGSSVPDEAGGGVGLTSSDEGSTFEPEEDPEGGR